MLNYNTQTIRYIHISIAKQRLLLIDNNETLFSANIATGKKGVGEEFGSECTPRGWHIVRAKIGQDSPINSVFIGRRWNGEIYSEQLQEQFPERDWILTRILWLSGSQVGFNRLGQCDTMQRYIYIHGVADGRIQGKPISHGCINMNNKDIVTLFDKVEPGIPVYIDVD